MDIKVIVSLTSFPARINMVIDTIKSLIKQTYQPYKILLYLSEEEFPNKSYDLPNELVTIEMKHDVFQIIWKKENLKSYKKLIYAAEEYGENFPIITADDDLIYDENMIELLIKSYIANPNLIHCHRVWKFIFNSNRELVQDNEYGGYWESGSFLNMPTSGAGVLFPPQSYYKDFFNDQLFLKLANTTDDLWFWANAVLNGIRMKVVDNNINFLSYIENSQEGPCLFNINGGEEGLNKRTLINLFEHYPSLKTILLNEFKNSTDDFNEKTNQMNYFSINELSKLKDIYDLNKIDVAVWGATGERSKKVKEILKKHDIGINLLVDSNFNLHGKMIDGIECNSIFKIKKESLIIITSNKIYHKDIYYRLLKQGFDKIYCIEN